MADKDFKYPIALNTEHHSGRSIHTLFRIHSDPLSRIHQFFKLKKCFSLWSNGNSSAMILPPWSSGLPDKMKGVCHGKSL